MDTEEPKTTALQILTASHITQISSSDTDITALQGRLDLTEPKTSALQTLTATHTTNIASNTADILTKQPLITTSTDLECNSITTNNLKVNGYITTTKYFNTIVVRRFDQTTSNAINLRELQTWVNGVNIMVNNGLTSYFALWS